MKVLWFTNTPSLAAAHLNQAIIGGGWISALEKMVACREGVELAVAFRYGEGKLEKFMDGHTAYYSIPYAKGKIRNLIHRHFNVIKDDELVNHCLDVVKDFEPDIINIFGTEDAWGLIANRINIPVVIHLQGILTVYEKKWFSAHIRNRSIIFSSSIKSILTANTLVHYYYSYRKRSSREQKIFKSCRYFLGRTDWDRRITSVLAPHGKYFVSNEILRNEFYQHLWNKTPQKSKTIISTIQPNIYKGLETVLQTAILLKELNEFSFTWYVAGSSEGDTIAKLFEKKIGKNLREVGIILSGKVHSQDLIKMELEADLFVHPSHIENSPNSVCEAMMLGMPVIATFTGGTGSLLEDKKEGILIQDGDSFSMAGAIIELINKPLWAAELGQNARIRAMERHNPIEIVNNLFSIYDEILNHERNEPKTLLKAL